MKIGILTYHRAHNYGAVLQCYALQEVLKSMGHDVWIIDYRQPCIEKNYKSFDFSSFWEHIFSPKILHYYLKTYPIRKKKKEIFTEFISKHLNTTCKCNACEIPQDFDAYIIGSDQVWGLHCIGNKKDEVYLGNFKHNPNSKIIGYAISTNKESLELLCKEGLSSYIKNFHSLSMREEFAANYIKKHTTTNPIVTIDPTLLTNKQTWLPLINDKWKNKKYVLIYQVRFLKNDKNFLYKKAKELANVLDCEIIDLSDMQYSVEDFLSSIKYAQYVITTSFHATIFSIIFNTPFYSVKLNDGHDERLVNVLNKIGLNEHCVNTNFLPNYKKIDFKLAEKKLHVYRESSISFLLNL